MSTPAQPVVTIQSELSTLAQKHVTLSYAILGVLVLAMFVACLGGYMGLRGYEKALAHAQAVEQTFEQKDQQYQQMIVSFQQQLAQDSADRQAATAKQTQLAAQIAARAKQPPSPVVQTGLQPDATAQEAGNALGAIFSAPGSPVVPMATPDGKVSVSVKEAQEMASLGLDGERSEADLKDEVGLYTLEQSKFSSLQKDLTSCQSTLSGANTSLDDAKKAIEAYKKAATKTKLQKVWNGIKTYGLPVLAYLVGRGKL